MTSSLRSLVLLATAGWGFLLFGLAWSRTAPFGWEPVDAGDRLGLNFEVYFPFYLLSVFLAVALFITLLWPRRGTAVLLSVTGLTLAAFAAHVLRVETVNAWRPDLALYACLSLVCALVVLAFSGLIAVRPTPRSSA